MDSKEQLIRNIIIKLNNIIPAQEIDKVEDILTMEFNGFKVESESTELSVYDDSNTKILKTFIATKRLEGLSEKSLKRYYDQNLRLLNFLGKPIKDISTNDIRFYLAVQKQRNNLNNCTVDGMRRCIATFWSFLTIEKYIDYNVCLRIKKIKCPIIVRQPLSDDEINRIRKSCNNDRDAALIEFLYSTGCRVSEIVGLNISDINGNQCIVRGKGSKERYIYLSYRCIDKLKRYLNRRNDSYPALFVGKGTNRLSKNGIERIVSNLGKVNDIHAFPHLYRHGFASRLANMNMDIQKIAALLGHSSVNTTMIYTHLSQNKIKEEYMKLMN